MAYAQLAPVCANMATRALSASVADTMGIAVPAMAGRPEHHYQLVMVQFCWQVGLTLLFGVLCSDGTVMVCWYVDHLQEVDGS